MKEDEWTQRVKLLQMDLNEYYQYDSGYTPKQKEKFSRQRCNAISKIKTDLSWPPFAEIAKEVTNSSWGFDECYDNIDGGMEQTISMILSRKSDE